MTDGLPETTSPGVETARIALLRKAGPARRLALASSLSCTVMELARGAIRRRHPEMDDTAVGLRFVEVHYGKPLADDVARHLQSRRPDATS